MTQFMKYFILFVFSLTCTVMCSAQTKAVGGGLDCNGFSPISKNVKPYMACTDLHGANGRRFYDNGWYIGHDEPSIQFFSNTPKSGYDLAWVITLPKQDPTPTQSGSSIATFELTPAFWLSLDLCDPNSYPQNACTPDSDSNTGTGLTTDAGSAVLELQFYPPGFGPQISCTGPGAHSTQWCAALTIDSLECTFNFAVCNANCEEPANFAFLQDNGVPTGPAAPGEQNDATFTPNSHTFFMNPGDKLLIIIKDTPQGLLTFVRDLTTGKKGFMVASGKNGFANTNISNCQTTPFDFHPEYSTAKPENLVPWASLELNVNIAVETGHFELGANGDNDIDDQPCFPGPTIAGCLAEAIGGDLDFDGPPYLADWPDGSTNHPSPILVGAFSGRGIGPMSFNDHGRGEGDPPYSNAYDTLQFETDIPQSEVLTVPPCNTATGGGCVVPPVGAAFYPFYSQLGSGDGCLFTFGNDIPGSTTNDFGKDAQYGSPSARFGGTLASGVMTNPCTP
jgi:hypothetical protein